MPIHSQLDELKAHIVITDSRYVTVASESVFFAIPGQRHDGHDYIDELIKKGVNDFVVSRKWLSQNESLAQSSNVNYYLSDNVLGSLQSLAAKHRSRYSYPVVGITGSNGKTIVKEWLDLLLKDLIPVVKSPRSYNSQVGVPLSVLKMNDGHEVGIFEAGISQPSEMQNLSRIISPTIGVFTNIGSAHDEGFKSRKQKITEKLRLFRSAKVLVYSLDYKDLDEEIKLFLKAINPDLKFVAWSKNGLGTLPVTVDKSDSQAKLTFYLDAEEYSFTLPFVDEASIENSIHAILAAKEVLTAKGYSGEEAIQILQSKVFALSPIAMRLELKQGINDCFLIDDTYNNDLGGLEMALNFMDQHHTTRNKVLILSDVLQSGLKSNELYHRIGQLVKEHGITEVIGVGSEISKYASEFNEAKFFVSTSELLKEIYKLRLHSKLILIKGARHFEFEKVVNALQQKVHGTKLEINLDAITHNLNFYRSKLNAETKIMAMVKASAYGSGGGELVSLLQYHRVDYLGVAYTDEGVELRRNGIELPIMVLNPQAETFDHLIQYKIEPEIYSLDILKSFLSYIKNAVISDEIIKIHLKIDTGMHRLGFLKQELEEVIKLIQNEKRIAVASIFSHLAGADESKHRAFTLAQKQYFDECKRLLEDAFEYKPLFHIANTAGTLRYPEFQMDMVRIGIGLYGVESNGLEQDNLQTVTSLTTNISQIKHLKAGETIGYGRAGVAQKDMKIATIAIGYADGFPRSLSQGRGSVLIKDKQCKVIGNVCMDMTMVDVTDVDCTIADKVIVFGESPSLLEFAKTCETIPYEVLTRISSRVKRVFYKE